jgi:hypothetical protein
MTLTARGRLARNVAAAVVGCLALWGIGWAVSPTCDRSTALTVEVCK